MTSKMHQRNSSEKMHEHLLYTSKITLNNDNNREISDFRSMPESRVKLCNNYESSNRCCDGSVSSKGDLPFSRNFLGEEKTALDLHTFMITTRQEFPSVNCQCTSHRQSECFINDVKSVPSDSNNLTGEYQKWKHRLTTSELLSHTRLVEKDDTILQKSAYRSPNSLSRLHTWRILLAICIAILCTTCNADPSECAKGINTPGWTNPSGDIVLEYGKPLRIQCILNQTMLDVNYPGKNVSDVVFFRNNKEIEPEYTTVINETILEMYIEKPPPSDDMYYCKLRITDEHHKTYHLAVCLNKVVIGFQPQKPTNFNCISYNWENMVCSWVPIHNYITTKYSIFFKLPGRAGRGKLFPCPQEERYNNQINSCTWDISTNPLYRQTYEYYLFILYGDNVLGNLTTTYKIHHFAQVIPAKPANFTLLNKTSESVFLYWSAPFPVNNFPGGLHYRLTYQNQWDSQKSWQVINFTEQVQLKQKYYNLTGLKYANSVYDVRVYAKSSLAEDDMWSNFSDVTFRTLPKLPGLPPKTDIGSFELMENNGYRDVYLYWQTIPPYLENGDNFRYQILRVDADGRKVSIQPSETTRTYAKFKGITTGSYRFEIVTTNVVGDSKNSSKIFVPSRLGLPREPVTFTKIAFDGGTYELSWKYPEDAKKDIINYTIYWCDNERDRPYQCTGYLDWVHVSKNTYVYNMTVPDPKKVYQFAISANTKYASSGMVWASCTVIHNKVASKMKSVWINKIGSDYIEVGWKLDCSDRVGIVEGFNIYYCPIIAPYNRNCKEPKLNTTIKADTTTIHGVIQGLKPYTTYKVTIAVLTKHGEGLHSDPLYNTTLEAAPSTSPQDVRIVNYTNSTLTVTWKSPTAMNGVLRYYEVYYNCSKKVLRKRVDETNHSELEGFNAQGNRSIQVELTNLYAHEEYTVEVEACTVACSAKSNLVSKRTKIGTPGAIMIPIVRFVNSSQVFVKWNKPDIAAGNLDYYQISSNDGEIQNSSHTEIHLPIAECKPGGQEKMYQFRVRAVNIAADKKHLTGPWSNTGEGNCYSSGPPFAVWIVIWVIGILSSCALLLCLFYTSKRTWLKCRYMRDVDVKLPHGIEPNMKLLQKFAEQHTRQSSADSSGCSSGQESVTSSLTSDSHVSSDSGADVDPIAVSPNKLLEIPTSWNPTSLRQRNVGNVRPGGVTDSTRWDPYVKVTKSGDPILTETLSIARSTPNLCESTSSTTSQNTWSSTGYMSMPSSEEISNNPSPVPHKDMKSLGYSVVGMNPKSEYQKSEDDKSQVVSTIEVKPSSNPYVSLASLEQKPKGLSTIDPLLQLEDITFSEMEESSNFESFSDKVSKPYVQSGFVELGEKPKVSFTPTLHTNTVVSKPLVSSSTTTTTTVTTNSPTAVHFTDISSKPYVTVASIPDLRNSVKVAETSKPYVLLDSPSNSVFQMLQQQKNNSDLRTCSQQAEINDFEIDGCEEEDSSNLTICWEPKSSEELKPEEKPKSTGYVTISETSKLEQPTLQNQRFSKQQNSAQSEEQYSKVTLAPNTMQ